jgi:uncharacterized protein YndB with AHSA1/START domain
MAISLHASVDIRAPLSQVFDIVCTPERLPEWNVSIEQARRASAGEAVCLGSRAIFRGRLLGQTLESETEVICFEPPRVFATRAIRGPRLQTRFTLESGQDCSRVDVEVRGEVPGGRLGEMFAEGFLRRELFASLDRLRELCESQSR